MFHIDYGSESDITLNDYIEELGIEYPVVNIQQAWSEYPVDGSPTYFWICPDKTLNQTIGFTYPDSKISANMMYFNCLGIDLTANISLLKASPASSSTLCSSDGLYYEPELLLMHNDLLDAAIEPDPDPENWFNTSAIDTIYQVEVFRNGVFVTTQSVNPNSDGSINKYDSPILDPIEVSPNDEITLVCKYPNDTQAFDDTIKVTIPSEVINPTSTTSDIYISGHNDLSYQIKNSNGDSICSGNGDSQFTLANGDCYKIRFINSHDFDGSLSDGNQNILISFTAGEYNVAGEPFGAPTYFYASPWFYFNVDGQSNTDINDAWNILNTHLISTEYFDVLGKKYQFTSQLKKGVYVEMKRYANGMVKSRKMYINQ